MDPSGPYRLAWRPSPPVNVRSSSRAALLDALEYGFPVTRSRIAELTHLGETTVRRACHQLLREQVMTLSYGTDAATGRHSDRITPALYPVLPVLEITESYLVWRLCDTRGGSVFATVRDRGGFCTPEDDLAALLGQVAAILRAGTCGLPTAVPLQPPALILPRGDTAWQEPLGRVLPQPPTCILTPEETTAHELRYLPAVGEAASLLHVRVGTVCTVSLLTRARPEDAASPFVPSPMASRLQPTLNEYLGRLRPHSPAWWEQIAAFLRDLCRFLTPDCAVLELDRDPDAPALLRAALPASVRTAVLRYALNTPSLAHRGALRLTRRALWDSMERPCPQG